MTTEPMALPPRTWWTCKRLKSHKGMDGRWQVDNEKDAILISSLTSNGLHAPCLDFDFPGMVMPWSGKWIHVSGLGVTRPWDAVHAALADAGLVSPNFYEAVINAHVGGPFDPSFPCVTYNVPVRTIPSSNPYKHHFYIDAEISWEKYVPIIVAMRELILLERNFANFSIEREMTMLLKPGLTKDAVEAMGIVIEENSDGRAPNDTKW